MSAKAQAGNSESKQSFWKKTAPSVPGSLVVISGSIVSALTPMRAAKKSIRDFDNDVQDAWDEDVGDDVAAIAKTYVAFSTPVRKMESAPASPSTARRLKKLSLDETPLTTLSTGTASLTTSPTRHSTMYATSSTATPSTAPSLQTLTIPKLEQKSVSVPDTKVSSLPNENISQSDHKTLSTSSSSSNLLRPTAIKSSVTDPRLTRFYKIFESQSADLVELRDLAWKGVPAEVRPKTWQLLCGYLPCNRDRRDATLKRKRDEYKLLIDQYYGTNTLPENAKTIHQIQVDIERTGQTIPLFRNDKVKELFWRILYIWSIRHPGSGYVQGINDLSMPFFIVFLNPYLHDCIVEEFDINILTIEQLHEIEADSFWCLSKLLDGIQDNFIFAQPGIQIKVKALKDLISRIDAPLHQHLQSNNIEYLQFALRWMNCLLMRELPLRCILRLWDTYHAEVDGFALFHQYVCAAFLETFSKSLLDCHDFQSILLLLQKLPTEQWGDRDIDLIVAEAFRLKFTFHEAQSHIPTGSA